MEILCIDRFIALGEKIPEHHHVFDIEKRNRRKGVAASFDSSSRTINNTESSSTKRLDSMSPAKNNDYHHLYRKPTVNHQCFDCKGDENIRKRTSNNLEDNNNTVTDTKGFLHVPDLQLYREKEINDAAQNISCRILLRYTTSGGVNTPPVKHTDSRFPASLPLIQLEVKKEEIKDEDALSDVRSNVESPNKVDDGFVEIDEDYESYDIERYLV